jgi:hypothetical protein
MTDPDTDWPFADARNLATITVRDIVDGRMPILLVTHDADDGGWTFLTGEQFSMADAMVLGLGEMFDLDPTLAAVADMPIGSVASRPDQFSPWNVMRQREADDDE